MSYMLDDLQQAGAGGYDSCGAGDETVALAKTAWGGRLMTEYSIEGYNLRSIKHRLGDMLRYLKRQKSVRGHRRAGGHADAPLPECQPTMTLAASRRVGRAQQDPREFCHVQVSDGDEA
jgi:hypothetical protein